LHLAKPAGVSKAWQQTHNLEVLGSSPSWSTLKIKQLSRNRLTAFFVFGKHAMVMDESIAINGQELLLALAIPSECNIEFIIGGFSTI